MSTRWHKSWEEGRIGFHASDVNGDLVANKERFLGGGSHRVFVPLCGKTLDMPWLADQGHEVVGVELVPQAVDEFFQEQGLEAERSEKGSMTSHKSGELELLCGDIFELGRDMIAPITRIWDRAAMVALDRDTRQRYVAKLIELAEPGALLLLNVFEYDSSVMDGPPFSVGDSEVRDAFAGSSIDLISEVDRIDGLPQFKDRGHDHWIVRNYLIELPS